MKKIQQTFLAIRLKCNRLKCNRSFTKKIILSGAFVLFLFSLEAHGGGYLGDTPCHNDRTKKRDSRIHIHCKSAVGFQANPVKVIRTNKQYTNESGEIIYDFDDYEITFEDDTKQDKEPVGVSKKKETLLETKKKKSTRPNKYKNIEEEFTNKSGEVVRRVFTYELILPDELLQDGELTPAETREVLCEKPKDERLCIATDQTK